MKGKIFIILGKSGTGKTTIFKYLRDRFPSLQVFKYGTTRPKRDENDNEYEFVSDGGFKQLLEDEKVLEYRTYDTEYGKWTYFTYNTDIDLSEHFYIMVGTLDVLRSLKKVFKRGDLIPILLEVPDAKERRYRVTKERFSSLNTNEEYTKATHEINRREKQDEIDFSRKRMLIFQTDLLFHEGVVLENKDLEETEHDAYDYVYRILHR